MAVWWWPRRGVSRKGPTWHVIGAPGVLSFLPLLGLFRSTHATTQPDNSSHKLLTVVVIMLWAWGW